MYSYVDIVLTSTLREWLETETENRLQDAQAGKPNELKALLGLSGGPSNNIKTMQMEIHKRIQFLWTDINSQSSTPPRVLIDLLLLCIAVNLYVLQRPHRFERLSMQGRR